jgi:hypothetical protein
MNFIFYGMTCLIFTRVDDDDDICDFHFLVKIRSKSNYNEWSKIYLSYFFSELDI